MLSNEHQGRLVVVQFELYIQVVVVQYSSSCSCTVHSSCTVRVDVHAEVHAVVNHAREHVNTRSILQGVHGSREPGCDKRGVNLLTYHYSARGGRCYDQCGARSGSPQ